MSKSLESAIKAAGGPVALARNSQIGPYVYPAVPAEFTNWREEQVAWLETCALFDQTHHMTDLYLKGPDVIRLLSDFGINSMANAAPNKAKQYVAVNNDGYVIGDAILFFLKEDKVSLVGRPSVHNWVQYHAETGDYKVEVDRDERTAVNPTGKRKIYRYQVQGPTALKVLEKATGGSLPDIKFFNMGELKIAGHKVRALHHGMSGAPGLELFGPWDERDEVKTAIVEAGQEFGLRQVGARVYATNTLESGWIPCPLPAVFTGDEMKSYREWLPANGYEATGSLGGSLTSEDIEDYYLTPWDLGYGGFIRSTTTSSGATPSRRWTSRRGARSRSRGTARTSRRRSARSSGRTARRRSTSTSRSRTTRRGRTTSSWPATTRSACRRSPATATTSGRSCRSASSTTTSRSATR